MPSFQITVVEPPSEFSDYTEIGLFLQTEAGFVPPVRKDAEAIVFEVPFELKADRSGVLQPTGPAVQRGDGRRFVYLSWCGKQGASAVMFRRLKVFFDRIPGFPGPLEAYRLRVKGTDKRGGPACATAEVLT